MPDETLLQPLPKAAQLLAQIIPATQIVAHRLVPGVGACTRSPSPLRNGRAIATASRRSVFTDLPGPALSTTGR